MPVQVTEPATGDQPAGVSEGVPADHELQFRVRGGQGVLDGGGGDVHDEEVELAHERGHQHHGEEQPGPRGYRGCHVSTISLSGIVQYMQVSQGVEWAMHICTLLSE